MTMNHAIITINTNIPNTTHMHNNLTNNNNNNYTNIHVIIKHIYAIQQNIIIYNKHIILLIITT